MGLATAGQEGGTLVLTSLSPLSGRSLTHTPAIDEVSSTLQKFGYAVSWDGGLRSPRPFDAPAGPVTIDTFMGGLTRKRAGYGFRPKVESSVTFTTKNSGGSTPSGNKLTSAASKTVGATTPPRPPSRQGSGTRFSRLIRSVDSLQQLQLQPGPNLHAANLLALDQAPVPRALPACPATATLPQQSDTACVDQGPVAEPASDDAARPGTSSSSAQRHNSFSQRRPATAPTQDLSSRDATQATQLAARPTTPVIDVSLGATEALQRPGSRHEHTDAHVHTRPFTASPISLSRRYTHAYTNFRPTRGHALVVFQHIDKDGNGKITLSELEDACLALGFSIDQAGRLFRKLDKRGVGYLKATDWGDADAAAVVELFSLAYMQRFMGLPGPTANPEQVSKYTATQELKAVRSPAVAVQMARQTALMRGARAASGGSNIVFEAFRFMDTDGSGVLSRDELRDGFYALGVFIDDDALAEIVRQFDTDQDGHVNYLEFCKKLGLPTS